MSAKIIDGAGIAKALKLQLAQQAAELATLYGRRPALAMILVGEDPASQIYVEAKTRQAAEIGIESRTFRMAATTSTPTLIGVINELNEDDSLDGILIQLPLPNSISPSDARAVLQAVDESKDVDGFHPMNVGRLVLGQETLVPCTPQGCMLLIKSEFPNGISGMKAVVLGRSNIVGKPMAQLLNAANATVTLAHAGTQDIIEVCRSADLLVVAVGQAEMVRGNWIKPGAVVVDVGISRINGDVSSKRIVGDVCFDEAKNVAASITPVPGGVGPMTIACLLQNTLVSARHRLSGASQQVAMRNAC